MGRDELFVNLMGGDLFWARALTTTGHELCTKLENPLPPRCGGGNAVAVRSGKVRQFQPNDAVKLDKHPWEV